jgi:hypothetical protein
VLPCSLGKYHAVSTPCCLADLGSITQSILHAALQTWRVSRSQYSYAALQSWEVSRSQYSMLPCRLGEYHAVTTPCFLADLGSITQSVLLCCLAGLRSAYSPYPHQCSCMLYTVTPRLSNRSFFSNTYSLPFVAFSSGKPDQNHMRNHLISIFQCSCTVIDVVTKKL